MKPASKFIEGYSISYQDLIWLLFFCNPSKTWNIVLTKIVSVGYSQALSTASKTSQEERGQKVQTEETRSSQSWVCWMFIAHIQFSNSQISLILISALFSLLSLRIVQILSSSGENVWIRENWVILSTLILKDSIFHRAYQGLRNTHMNTFAHLTLSNSFLQFRFYKVFWLIRYVQYLSSKIW